MYAALSRIRASECSDCEPRRLGGNITFEEAEEKRAGHSRESDYVFRSKEAFRNIRADFLKLILLRAKNIAPLIIWSVSLGYIRAVRPRALEQALNFSRARCDDMSQSATSCSNGNAPRTASPAEGRCSRTAVLAIEHGSGRRGRAPVPNQEFLMLQVGLQELELDHRQQATTRAGRPGLPAEGRPPRDRPKHQAGSIRREQRT